ncbi:MAG: DNA ligase, partial [Verrucomicrobia bacterium]|nr:DNA ligase [Verrucomicrobiota bacterium]
MIDVRFARGVYLPDQDLWLDPAESQTTAFISHAHSDHIGDHAEVILSRPTSRLMAARLPGARIEHALEFSQPLAFRGATLSLLPAGHIYGSAQLYLQNEHGSLLYTGDFKLRHGQSAEPIKWRSAETLVMETTYGLPQYQFPPAAEVIADLVDFCTEAIADHAVPVLFGYSLGKAQEILAALNGSGLRILLHPSVYRLTRLYDDMLHRLPPFAAMHEQPLDGAVLICPPGANRTRLVQKIKNRRTAVLTGWALDPGAVHRYQCDAAFPLSDHADYPDLIRYVELVAPRRVLTLHGFAREFAEDLRRQGIEAWALGDDNQLELSIGLVPNNLTKSTSVFDPDSEFKAFTTLCEKIGAQSGKLEKVRLLSEYLRELDAAVLPIVAIYLTGHVFARSTDKNLQVGWSVIKNALLKATGLSESEFRRIAAAYGDAGKVAFETLLQRTNPRPFTLQEIDQQFSALDQAKGPLQKNAVLGSWLSELSPLGGSYVIR